MMSKDQLSKDNHQPTKNELHECVLLIMHKLPHCSVNRVISKMYQTLIKENKISIQEQKLQISRKSSLRQLNLSKSKIQQSKIKQEYQRRENLSRQNKNNHKWVNDPQFQEIATMFCKFGYGYPRSRQAASFDITPNKYNNFLSVILRMGYRRLEELAKTKVHKLTKDQHRILRNVLVKCRQWMPTNELKIFYKCIKQIDQNSAEITYFTIINRLKFITHDKQVPYLIKKEDNFWSEATENDLCKMYLKHKRLSDMFQEFIVKHINAPSQDQVEQKLQFILKKSLQIILKQHTFSINLMSNEFILHKIFSSTSGLQCRIKLIMIYLDRYSSSVGLESTIEALDILIRQ